VGARHIPRRSCEHAGAAAAAVAVVLSNYSTVFVAQFIIRMCQKKSLTQFIGCFVALGNLWKQTDVHILPYFDNKGVYLF
jgi:hypothetical protein